MTANEANATGATPGRLSPYTSNNSHAAKRERVVVAAEFMGADCAGVAFLRKAFCRQSCAGKTTRKTCCLARANGWDLATAPLGLWQGFVMGRGLISLAKAALGWSMSARALYLELGLFNAVALGTHEASVCGAISRAGLREKPAREGCLWFTLAASTNTWPDWPRIS